MLLVEDGEPVEHIHVCLAEVVYERFDRALCQQPAHAVQAGCVMTTPDEQRQLDGRLDTGGMVAAQTVDNCRSRVAWTPFCTVARAG